jgi:hypothetical protein
LEAAESHLRLHIRPYFDARPLGSISMLMVQRWQDTLEVKLSYTLVMGLPVAAEPHPPGRRR